MPRSARGGGGADRRRAGGRRAHEASVIAAKITGPPTPGELGDQTTAPRVGRGRDAKRLQSLAQNGAEASVGNVEDLEFLASAFEGATVIYLVVPEDTSRMDLRAHQECVSDSFAAAVSRAHVPYVIALSSIGAQHKEKTGPIVGLHNLEQKLNRISGLNVLHLRCGYFMENLLLSLAPLHAMGMLPGGMRADFTMPWIATRDTQFSGVVYPVNPLVGRFFCG